MLRNIFSRLLNKPEPEASEDQSTHDFDSWNRIGRAKAINVCAALEAIIDLEESPDEDLVEDERDEEFADAVLDEVVALNAAGHWQRARERFDPAHQPFTSHMGDIGLHAVVILGPEAFLVRLGDEVLHIDGGDITPVDGGTMVAVSRNRRWIVVATGQGLAISEGFDPATQEITPWPEDIEVDATTVRSLEISDDGCSVVLASDEFGIWLMRGSDWTLLAPRPGHIDEDDEDEDGDEDDDAAENDADTTAEDDDADDGVRNVGTEDCPVYIGSYKDIKAKFGGPLGIDASHVAISPDGQYVAYGWQDAYGGHYVERVTETTIEPHGRIESESDYPYNVRFTDDSASLLSNSRYGSSGVTVCRNLASLANDDDDDNDEETQLTDDYLRAYGMTQLPGEVYGLGEPVAWIGGAGWSHAAPLSGGKPVFTQFLGSALRGFDFDPVSGRVAVASASGVLHVLDPFSEAQPGRERGYHPRREVFRWIFWETLENPIRW
jgi:hypothetical protein